MSDKFSTGEPFTSVEEAEAALSKPRIHLLRVDEGERQMMLLALAELSLEHPGWVAALEAIARKMDNVDENGQAKMFEQFRRNHSDPVYKALLRS